MAVQWKKVVVESSSGTIAQDTSGNAATATALATARGLQVTLTETDASNFDGSADVTDIGVTGTLAVTNGGTGLASFPKGSLLQADAANSLAALSGDPSTDNGKVVAYNATDDLFELVDSGTATNATNVTVTDNENTNEDNLIAFVANAASTTGNHGLEMDGDLTYNPSTGNLSATQLTGTIQTAAQGNITSLGTLTALTVDDVAINGKVITMTGSTGDTATFTAGTNGTLDIVTTDAVGAAANIQITADGTAELAGTTVTLDSSGGITLDADGGTITFADGGVSLGTITSSGYSGNAATATVATTVTITDNESTNENNPIVFVAGADADGGNLGLETDGNAHYNPSTGTITATNLVASTQVTSAAFVGDLTGNVTGTSSLVAVTDSTANTAFPVVFNNESNQLLDDTGAFTYNPSSGTLVVPNLTVSGTTTTVQTSTLTVEDVRIVAANPESNAVDDGTQASNATGGGLALNTHLTPGTNDANYAAVTWSSTGDLTGWRFRDTAGGTDYAAAVMKVVTNSATAPTTAAEAGVGTFHFAQANATSDGALYLRVQ